MLRIRSSERFDPSPEGLWEGEESSGRDGRLDVTAAGSSSSATVFLRRTPSSRVPPANVPHFPASHPTFACLRVAHFSRRSVENCTCDKFGNLQSNDA